MHKMPAEARRHTLAETIRVLKSGGRLVITEYGEEPRHHWIYRLSLLRKQILYWKPFLQSFWCEDLKAMLQHEAKKSTKTLRQVAAHSVFNGFYRVLVYEIDD